jgi:hypothetical protein
LKEARMAMQTSGTTTGARWRRAVEALAHAFDPAREGGTKRPCFRREETEPNPLSTANSQRYRQQAASARRRRRHERLAQ